MVDVFVCVCVCMCIVEPSSRKQRIVASDGDWGWYVVSGCAFANFLLPGMLRSFGSDVLDQFTEIYEFDYQYASRWIPTTFDLMFYVAGTCKRIVIDETTIRHIRIIIYM